MVIDVDAIPCPAGVSLARWLGSFPSFGFLLAVAPEHCGEVIAAFCARDIAAAEIGEVRAGSSVMLARGGETAVVWDYGARELLGLGK
jgi:selenophosphate synthetase-related protein